jgi:SAM-dependent methyltransferase
VTPGDADAGLRQKAHYERMHDVYEAHYYDPTSLAYRDRFLLEPLVAGLDLDGAHVLDLACGSGFTTQALQRRFPRLTATGLDISEAACRAFERTTGGRAIPADLTRPWTPERTFDAAIVIGGLHHCVADLRQALANVAAALRPGGVFLMMEPSAECWLEGVRRLWYRRDRYFDAPTEQALGHDDLVRLAGGDFEADMVRYLGGPAYFAILNSLVLRVPLAAKPWLAPALFPLESAVNALNSRRAGPIFIARWRRTGR